MRTYLKKSIQPMRPYVLGESLKGITISKRDIPETGGMIACNPNNPSDMWYVSTVEFADKYEEMD